MDEREKNLLKALVYMARQYLVNKTRDGREVVDSYAMGAGEYVIPLLEEYGLVELIPGGRIAAYWTKEADESWAARGDDLNLDNAIKSN